jgi:hypothetical protein
MIMGRSVCCAVMTRLSMEASRDREPGKPFQGPLSPIPTG